MVKFDFSSLSAISARQGVTQEERKKYMDRVGTYVKAMQDCGNDFLAILDDRKIVSELKDFAKSLKGKYAEIAILGIGGSALAASCLRQALGPLSEGASTCGVHLTVLDNIDPVLLVEFLEKTDLKKTLFLVITKSGGTPETLAQFLYFKTAVSSQKLDWRKHFVFVTDSKKGLLREFADQNPQVPVFDIPEKVGGRFSIFSVVGLLPAVFCGFDVDKLMAGARSGRKRVLETRMDKNPAYELALSQYLLYKKGKMMTVLFSYAQKLMKLSEWYRQLLAESIGKEKDRKGHKVNIGITPVSALGATDQHSQSQLYQEGPNNKLFIFLEVQKPPTDPKIPVDSFWKTPALNYLRGVSFNKLLLTEMAGTMQALLCKNRPLIKVSLDKLDAAALGELLIILEASVAFLAELFDINAYDQPGVELSKRLTRELL